ncbi:MAG: succinylglutamate desuccinylase/aspartoacylase family protein [Halobacteriaceae archaeon]
MTALGSASAEPGEVATGRLEVGETRLGWPAALPVAVVEGASDGPTLYLQAASDGDELNGVAVIRRVVSGIDPEALSGTLLVVGVTNVYAFQAAEHRNPIDDTKLNRAYPGDPNGSTSERIAHETFEAARRADLVLDLHQGSTSRMIDEVRVRCGRHHPRHGDCLELAKAFDAGHVLDQKGPDGQLARAAPEEGVPAVDPELGGAVGWDESSIQTGVRGVYGVLRSYGFLEEPSDPGTQTRIRGFDRYNAPAGGLVDLVADLGDRVEAGDELFAVTDPFGTRRTSVSADSAGILWRTRRLPQVATGEYVCSVGTDIDEY